MNTRIVTHIVLLIVSICLVSCKNDEVKSAYNYYNLEQVGWKSRTVTNHYSNVYYKAALVPTAYYVLKSEGVEDTKRVDSIMASVNDERIFELEISLNDRKEVFDASNIKMSTNEAIKHLAFGIQEDLSILLKNGKKIDCQGVTFERNYHLAPFKRILVHFSGVPENSELTLLYNDNLFEHGNMSFTFEETPIILN